MFVRFSLETLAADVAEYQQMVQTARQALAEAALTGSPEDIANRLNTVAEYEGAVRILATTERILAAFVKPWAEMDAKDLAVQVVKYLQVEMSGGSDDTWSGRTNDVRRAYADGRRTAYNEVVTRLLNRA